MKTEIVIARYKENLDWLKKIKKSKDIKITVYNKGLPDIDIPFIQLPNSGRESGTYLYHIINNYDKLADQTIFCQGDPIFHAPDLIELINKYRTKFEPVQPLSLSYWREDEPPHYEPNPPNPTIKATKNLWFSNKGRVHVEYMNNDFESDEVENIEDFDFSEGVLSLEESDGYRGRGCYYGVVENSDRVYLIDVMEGVVSIVRDNN